MEDVKALSAKYQGTFFIRPRKNKNGTIRWYVKFEFTPEGAAGPKEVSLPKIAYHHFGFSASMTVIAAKQRAALLNKERSTSNKKFVGAAIRHANNVNADETFFPENYLKEFMVYLEESVHGTAERFEKVCTHFGVAQRLIRDTKLTPSEYAYRSNKIYKWFTSHGYSLDYCHSVIRVLNMWGKHVCRLEGRFWDPVKNPKGRAKTSMLEAYNAKGKRTASKALNPDTLVANKENFKPEQYNWIYLTLWLGLRPAELNEVKYEVYKDKDKNVNVIKIFQPKLAQLPEEQRWKHIPVIYPEQVKCVEILNSGIYERPLAKTISRYFGPDFHLYGGRKAFTDIMLERGQNLVDVSKWMGHQTLDRTWRHYMNRSKVNFVVTLGMLRPAK
jgi:integrase